MMQKYLELVVELLELPNKEKVLEAGKLLEANSSYTLKTAHPYGFIFEAYRDLLSNKITGEEFIKVGDVDSPYRISGSIDPFVFVQSLSYETDDTIAIVDRIAEQEIDIKMLPKNIVLVFC